MVRRANVPVSVSSLMIDLVATGIGRTGNGNDLTFYRLQGHDMAGLVAETLLPLWDLSSCDDAHLLLLGTCFEGQKKQMTAGEDSFSCISRSIFESN